MLVTKKKASLPRNLPVGQKQRDGVRKGRWKRSLWRKSKESKFNG